MEKVMLLRSICRSTILNRSSGVSSLIKNQQHFRSFASRTFFRPLNPSSSSLSLKEIHRFRSDYGNPFARGIGSVLSFSEDITHFPTITDPDIRNAFKDLMAASWDELPDALIHDTKNAVSKNTDDKAGQEALTNVFRAAEAAEEFIGMLITLRMEIDDSIGLSGENVKPLPDEFNSALLTAYNRYTAYLDAFGPDEVYLRKKVEQEIGTRMIHLKMRCAGLSANWGKVRIIFTRWILRLVHIL
ncbi:Succinate dehydrogenase subunit 5, mitochondrial, partial [Dillenia turbinata]